MRTRAPSAVNVNHPSVTSRSDPMTKANFSYDASRMAIHVAMASRRVAISRSFAAPEERVVNRRTVAEPQSERVRLR